MGVRRAGTISPRAASVFVSRNSRSKIQDPLCYHMLCFALKGGKCVHIEDGADLFVLVVVAIVGVRVGVALVLVIYSSDNYS